MKRDKKFQDIYNQSIDEVREFLKFTKRVESINTEAKIPFKSIMDMWQSRHGKNLYSKYGNIISVDDIKFNDNGTMNILICTSSETPKNIQMFDHVYNVSNKGSNIKTKGHGLTVIDVNEPELYQGTSSNVIIYFNQHTGSFKRAQKLWKCGDIRSFNQIDSSIYAKYFDPEKGNIPSKYLVTILLAKSNHPDANIYIHGIGPENLPAWDQVCAKNINIQYVY